jgi:hypothetical protein
MPNIHQNTFSRDTFKVIALKLNAYYERWERYF